MKIVHLAMAAVMAAGSLGVAATSASADTHRGRYECGRGHDGRHDCGRHMGRKKHRVHQVRVCKTVWRHHHRVRVCHTEMRRW